MVRKYVASLTEGEDWLNVGSAKNTLVLINALRIQPYPCSTTT